MISSFKLPEWVILMKYDKYIALALQRGAADAVEFDINQIVFDSRTLLKCMFGCSDWGYGHTCPSRPGSLKPWEYETILRRYLGGVIIHAHDKRVSQDASFAVEQAAFGDGYYFAFSMADCAVCGECSGKTGAPCRNVRMARPAFHSVGIDVFATAKALGLPIYTLTDKDQEQNWYSACFIE